MSAESGRISGETLAHMIELALDGRLDGITFAPLNKAALHAGGWRFNDEHQMFAHLTRHQGFFGEMNVLDNLWMSRVTSHVSLRTALDQITPERIDAGADARRCARCAARASPRRASRWLRSIRTPARTACSAARRSRSSRPPSRGGRSAGSRATVRFPSDTVFLKAFGGEFDGVLTMYHDQGQIATKLKGFNRGVTVTGGLATVFTTPAHGTAFDIVGKGVRPPARSSRRCACARASRRAAETPHRVTA